MGFFDRLAGKKASRPSVPATPATPPAVPPAPPPPADAANPVMARLSLARELLESQDVPGAMAIYEEVLATAGDRSDVLVTISGDLGVNGRVAEIVELLAPRYDAVRHGPAAGINLLQAYLATGAAESAQHVLDLLFALNRPDLQERLYGFSNAVAELMQNQKTAAAQTVPVGGEPPQAAKISLVSISKPIWYYGLEPMAEQLLPPKTDRLRKIAFAQLALLGVPDAVEVAKQPEDELHRLTRALPLWLAEAFHFSSMYAPVAAVGLIDQHYALFPVEWTTENLRQLVDTNKGALDYVFTGALRHHAGDYELLLRVWEVRKFRERKQFTARWTPATADAELGRLLEQIRLFMEWAPAPQGLPYAPPRSPSTWLATLGTSLSLFLAEKQLLPPTQLALVEPTLARAATDAAHGEAASLAFLTLRRRAERLSLAAQLEPALASSPLIAQARQSLQG
jgi:hypothetical protein